MSECKIRISIISLEEDKERCLKLVSQISNYKLNCNVVSAVNGKRLTAIEYFMSSKCNTSKLFGRTLLSPSELGCFLSHKKALYDFINSTDEWLLVLEDDVSVCGDLSYFYEQVPLLPRDGIFILGGQDGLKSFSRVVLSNYSDVVCKVRFGTKRWLYRTCCYLISKEVAEKILMLMEEFPYMADDWSYISSKTGIKNFYFAKMFSHPVDLSYSKIELERDYLSQK
ncbi:glycosyltransferase family 25 protein [Shewanella sp. SP2S2-6]|uniref:glycosyltransferase family 25 protein n=1 Tax=Shewanella sp. SP2S2-6 TaxID=3063540 RepID=UPI00288D00F4|nr:glycosyltransferase family 25 protein [Shewanella sp. SP2S2-6]MDT3296873.1 glycosyltransferase family 25 protein [Shewanella sp. SP2S2-6]